MKKTLLMTGVLLLLMGCSSKKYYTIGNAIDVESTINYTEEIDVVNVEVPRYLSDYILVRQVSPYQVEPIEKAEWLTPMQRRLTNILIDYLQKSMNNPNVHFYPWSASKNPLLKISVKIKRFIAYKKEVNLEASYKITNLKTGTVNNKFFNTNKKIESETIDSMMSAMEEAYLELSEHIKGEIIK